MPPAPPTPAPASVLRVLLDERYTSYRLATSEVGQFVAVGIPGAQGLGDTVVAAREQSAHGCELIGFEGKTYRRDIAWREIRRTADGAGAARG